MSKAKKPARKTAASAPPIDTTAVVVPALPAVTEPPKEEAWSWTPEREKAVSMVAAGIPSQQIADQCGGVHRNTISNWKKQPEFAARVRELHADRVDTTRQRRHVETTIFTDKISKLAHQQLDAAIKDPKNHATVNSARAFLAEYRAFRAEERIDTGDNVVHLKHEHNGEVQHSHTIGAKSFKGFLNDAIGERIINAESIEAEDVHGIIVAATQQALLEGTLLDDLAEEERHLKLDAHTQSEKR